MKTQLYRCYSADGTLLYVGVSINALRRLAAHKASSARWFESLATIAIDHFPSRAEALAAKKQAILFEEPLYD